MAYPKSKDTTSADVEMVKFQHQLARSKETIDYKGRKMSAVHAHRAQRWAG